MIINYNILRIFLYERVGRFCRNSRNESGSQRRMLRIFLRLRNLANSRAFLVNMRSVHWMITPVREDSVKSLSFIQKNIGIEQKLDYWGDEE